MRVLSIDWDFFQDVSIDTLKECYPDGYDSSTALSEIVWGSRYASYGEEIEAVTLLKDDYKAITSILLAQNKNCPVMIANSHLYAYNFVLDNMKQQGAEKIRLTNIDMHHDLINSNPDVDCGNWIGKLAEQKLFEQNGFKWINNKVSFEIFGFNKKVGNKEIDTKFRTLVNAIDGGNSVSALKGEKYDAIFLARSDIWSPPHLDPYFSKLIDDIRKHFKSVICSKEVVLPRTDYIDIAEQTKKALKDCYERE